MEPTVVAALALAIVSLAAFAILACSFWHGSLLVLLTGPVREDDGCDEARRKLGKRMAAVLMAAGTLMATLVVFLAGELARNASIVVAASMANNVAFLAFVVSLLWFFVAQRPSVEKGSPAAPRRASLDHLPGATIVFVVALLAVVGAVGIVAAGL